MRHKNATKLIVFLTLFFMLLSNMQALALTYSPGPTEYKMEIASPISQTNTTLNASSIVFGNGGGSVKYDLFLPFDSETLTVTYTSNTSNVNLTVNTDEYTYTKTLKAGGVAQTIPITEISGSNTVSLSLNGAVTITEVRFSKVNEKYNEYNTHELPLNEYEEAVLTSVIVKDNAPVIKTKGAIHRLDIENTNLTPINIEGRLYVPFKKFAESLGYYAEDFPDKSFIYMTGETQSLSLTGGKGYIETDKSGQNDIELKMFYRDGATWVPVRALSEILGFTVEYRDGFVVVDDRLRAKKVVGNETVFSALLKEFSEYISSEQTGGKTYHVAQKSTAGSSLGTKEAPFKTLAEAASVATAGDTVIVYGGTYREELKPKNSGTALSPITFCAASGEKVVISALEPLTGFSTYKGNILSVSVAKDLGFGRNQLFYKGEALVEGRHPNEDTKEGVVPYPENISPFYATRGNMKISVEGGNVVESTTDLEQTENNYWQGATYVTLKGEGWSLVSGEVVSSSKGQLTVKDHDGTKSYNLGLVSSPAHSGAYYYKKVHDSDYGYLTNHINTLDIPGEWYMKDNKLYMIAPQGANLNSDFEIKQRQRVIDLRGKQYITIKNINTIGGGITMGDDTTRGCVLNGGTHKYIAHHTILLDQSKYSMTAQESFDSLQSLKAGEAGIVLNGQNNAVVNAAIDHSSATGITLLGKYHYINNNVISNTSYSGGYPGGIYVAVDSSKGEAIKSIISGGHFITYNTVYNSGRSVLLMGSSYGGKALAVSPLEIAYNRFAFGALTSRDTGITYEYGFTGGNDTARTKMHHNFVYNPGYKDEDTGHNLYLIYHDGYVASRDTYCNVTYYEEKDKAPRVQVFDQDAQYSVLRSRNNAQLGYLENGELDIKRTDFPGERPFYPGSNHGTFAERYMENYENLRNGVKSNYPVSAQISQNTRTFRFENVHIESGNNTLLTIDLAREANKETSFKIKARIYTKTGTLVSQATMLNKVENTRFYVEDTYKGIVVLPQIETGDYVVEIEFNDLYTEAYRLHSEAIDTEYDNLFTPEMELSGVVPYYPKKAEENIFTGTETITFEDVYIEGGKNVLLDLHMLREYDKENLVEISANVYDSKGSLVGNAKLLNNLKHTENNTYEPLSGIVVVPGISKSGNYKVTIKLSDKYSDAIRLLATVASSEYDSLFDENVFLGGTFNSWTNNGGGGNVASSVNLTLENIANYNYRPVGNTWNHTLKYSNRTIKENANTLRVTYATDKAYEGTIVNLYVDSLNSEPIATWKVYDSQWLPKTEFIPLTRELTAGTHTFYFVHNYGDKGYTSCATLYNFSFHNWINSSLVQDFDDLSNKTYTASNESDFLKETGLSLTLGGNSSSVAIEQETNGNKVMKYTAYKDGHTLDMVYDFASPIEMGTIEASFSINCTRNDGAAWHLFNIISEDDVGYSTIKYQGSWGLSTTNGVYKRIPSVNPDTGRYHLSATISRTNKEEDWTLKIFDDYSDGTGQNLCYTATIPNSSHPEIGKVKLIRCYPVAGGGYGIIDDVKVTTIIPQ